MEPVPRFLAFLHWSLAANGIRAVAADAAGTSAEGGGGAGPGGGGGGGQPRWPWPVSVVDKVVTKESGGVATMTVPRKWVCRAGRVPCNTVPL